jgi:hypothetical protein
MSGRVTELEAMGFSAEKAKAAVAATVSADPQHAVTSSFWLPILLGDDLSRLLPARARAGWRCPGSGGVVGVARES